MRASSSILRGASAGLLATGVMSLPMPFVRRAAPRDVSRGTGRLAGRRIGEVAESVWPASHAAMGATLGVVYRIARPVLPASTPVAGALFGAGAWAAMYAGLLPAAAVYPSPRADRRVRAVRVAALHLVYGVSLAYADRAISQRLA
jgi:hypothetical protein